MPESWKQQFVTYLQESTTATSLIWQALAVKDQNLPSRIYKYRCDNPYTRANLDADSIWTCSPALYNDPYDSWLSMPTNVLAQLLEHSLKKNTANAEKYLDGISQIAISTVQNLKIFRDLAKVCSFSEVHDSILMWSHYSDHHRGLCIEYDLTILPYHHSFRRNLYPVFYSADLYDLSKFAEALAGPSQGFRPYMPLLAMLYKFDGWQYEREWRFVREVPQVQADAPASAPVPSRIFLGARFDDSASKELLAICQKKHIPLFKMKMADDKYKLQVTDFS
ncbi:MAG TPA: DUF2971 domain-containing protein [Verrucomicrobiae bacterium]|nr:DUF2971 domain-containing protein [Verrucomicrobiae bacterium]